MTALRSNMGILRLKRGITAFGLEKQGGISLSTHENCGKKTPMRFKGSDGQNKRGLVKEE